MEPAALPAARMMIRPEAGGAGRCGSRHCDGCAAATAVWDRRSRKERYMDQNLEQMARSCELPCDRRITTEQCVSMRVRTQITIDRNLQRRAQAKAARLGISFSEYVRRLVAA